jgi:acyl-coenzyme A thioesterase PaaI-like protein
MSPDAANSSRRRPITVNFLAPLTEGPVLGEGAVTRKGRSTVFLEAALRSSPGPEYAHSSSAGDIRRPIPK